MQNPAYTISGKFTAPDPIETISNEHVPVCIQAVKYKKGSCTSWLQKREFIMLKNWICTALILPTALFFATGCDKSDDATEPVTQTVTVTSSSPTATPVTTTVTQQPVAARPSAPTVVRCLEGTPGPTLMSDGSTQYTDFCFQLMGGPKILEAEKNANAPTVTTVQTPSPWVQGQIDWANCVEAGHSEEWCDENT